MSARLQIILFSIVAAVAAVDVAWAAAGHFDIDVKSYAMLALLAAAVVGGALYYERYRREPQLGAMLIGTGFLIAYSESFSVLNSLLLTVAGHRIDEPLAAVDRALGFDWPVMMAWAAAHPLINAGLQLAYISVLPQIALIVTVIAWRGREQTIYALCLALIGGAAISIGVWTVAPSFGAFSVYELPPRVSSHLALALDGRYGHDLVQMLAHGPGYISPHASKGLIGFPSFHAVLALFVVWYSRELPVTRWFTLALNTVVLIATPIQGGHHVIDVIAGFAVAALAILFADRAMTLAARAVPRVATEPQIQGI